MGSVTIVRCRRCNSGDTTHQRHGTTTCYQYCGCRCSECRNACAQYVRKNTASKRGDPEWVERRRLVSAAWRGNNREKLRERSSQWRSSNRIRINAEARQAYSALPTDRIRHEQERRRRYRDQNRYKMNAYVRDWRSRNQSSVAVCDRRFRAKQSRVDASNERTWSAWATAEDAVVMREDISVLEMAHILGRTYRSITTRRRRLRLGDVTNRESREAMYRAEQAARRQSLGHELPPSCANGHRLTASTAYITVDSQVQCRTCKRASKDRFNQRRKAVAA